MIYIKGQVWESAKIIASSAKYRMDEQFQNCEFSQFSFSNLKEISKFLNFPILTIPETLNLENSKKFQCGQFRNFKFGKFQKFPKSSDFEIHQIF